MTNLLLLKKLTIDPLLVFGTELKRSNIEKLSSWLSEDVYKLLRSFFYNKKLVIKKKKRYSKFIWLDRVQLEEQLDIFYTAILLVID